MRRLLFISATDTGIGKTFLAERLLAILAGRGLRAVGMKPVETGFAKTDAAGSDGERLRRAGNVEVPTQLRCPYRFAWPAAPLAAARREGKTVDVGTILSAVEGLKRQADVIVVEGAGGLAVPLTEDYHMIDLAADLGAGVVLVARSSLGTLNHTLLSVEALRARGMDLAGVVLNRIDADVDPELEQSNLDYLREHVDAPCWGPIPRDADVATVERTLDTDALIGKT